jgi:hypothetical protein
MVPLLIFDSKQKNGIIQDMGMTMNVCNYLVIGIT